jgi:hypothetical protein
LRTKVLEGQSELLVRIGATYIVEPSTVKYTVTAETVGCAVEVSWAGVKIT